MTRRRTAVALALALPAASLALAAPASASDRANEVVYASSGSGGASVLVRNLSNRATTTVLAASSTTTYDEPELSPAKAGNLLVADELTTTSSGLQSKIVVVDRDTRGKAVLASVTTPRSAATLVELGSPTFSPDGTTVLYSRRTLSGGKATSALFTVPRGGGTPTAVKGGEAAADGSYDPQGTAIVFSAPSGTTGTLDGPLRVITDLAQGTTVDLGVSGESPKYSPDGSSIAFSELTNPDSDTRRGADLYQIATVASNGAARAQVLAASRPASPRSVAANPSWLPDGESLVFDYTPYDSAGDLQRTDLYAVDARGARAGKVVSYAASDNGAGFAQGPRVDRSLQRSPQAQFVPASPVRVLDTLATKTRLGPGDTTSIVFSGASAKTPLPANATAVVLNVTVLGGTAATDVRVYPGGTTIIPPNSSINTTGPNQTVPNQVTSALGPVSTTDPSRSVTLRNSGGTVSLLADLQGYYVPAAAGTTTYGFTSVDPARILSTRAGLGRTGTTQVTRSTPVDLQVTGTLKTADGTLTIPADATAVVLNVTGVGPTTATDIRVYPTPSSGSAVPQISDLNLAKGQVAANLVTVAVGAGGKVRLYDNAGAVHLLADIAGWYGPSGAASFVAVVPVRVLDTRDGTGGAPLATPAGAYVDVALSTNRGIDENSPAVVVNLTGTGVTAPTDVRAYPSTAGSVPTVSNLNLLPGQTRANAAIVRPGSNGRVRVRNNSGEVTLIADVVGYFITG